MQYAQIGYQVYGFDISPNNVTCASRLAQKHHCEDTTHFSVGIAEALQYPDAWFDIVIGVDILHHVEVGRAVAECSRVLKPGGVAIFHEPVRAPVYDTLRDSRLGTWLMPKAASLERHITEDERKLGPADIAALRSFNGRIDMTHFLLLSRLSRFFPGTMNPLEDTDQALFRAVPFMRRFAGRVVVTLQK
jgi:SAM-dependent methyltransferase